MPLSLRLTLANGQTRDVSLPVEVWFEGNHYVYLTELPARVTRVVIDPDGRLPDLNRRNNTWSAP